MTRTHSLSIVAAFSALIVVLVTVFLLLNSNHGGLHPHTPVPAVESHSPPSDHLQKTVLVEDQPTSKEVSSILLRVTNRLGKPVEGASVLREQSSEPYAITNDAGLCKLPIAQLSFLPDDSAIMTVSHREYALSVTRIYRWTQHHEVVLSSPSTITVCVANDTASPIEGAEVSLVKSAGTSHLAVLNEVKTDRDGRALLTNLPAGLIGIRVHADTYEDVVQGFMIVPDHRDELSIILRKAKALVVKVVTQEQLPVANAQVQVINTLVAPMWTSWTLAKATSWTANTDDSGTARFSSIPRALERTQITVTHDDYPTVSQAFSFPPDAQVPEVVVMLPTAASIVITVVDSQGRPTVGSLTIKESSPPTPPEWRRTMPYAGSTVTIKGIPVNKLLELVFEQHGATLYRNRDLNLTPGERRDLRVSIPGSLSLNLIAKDRNGVSIGGYVELTNSDGRIDPPVVIPPSDKKPLAIFKAQVDVGKMTTIRILPGNYTMEFFAHGGGRVKSEVAVFQDTDMTITLPNTGNVSGVLVDETGQPISGYRLRWFDSTGAYVAASDNRGAFSFSRVGAPQGKLYLINEVGYTVLVFEGDATGRNLTIRYVRGQVRGRVLGPTGAGVSAIVTATLIEYYPEPGGSEPGLFTTQSVNPEVAGDGTFVISLPKGTWKLMAETQEMESKPVSVRVEGIVDTLLQLTEQKKP